MHTKRILLAIPGAILAAILAAAFVYGIWHGWARPVNSERFGQVRVFAPWLYQRGFVYVLSGAEGWTHADEYTALIYAAQGNYVTAIDTPRLLEHLNRQTQGCLYMPGLFDDYSREQQRAAGTAHFYEPALLGRGAGATLVYLAQIGAPPSGFSAAVMLDPEPRLALTVPPCDHPPVQRDTEGEQLDAAPLGGNVPARLWLDAHASPASRAFVAAMQRSVRPAPAAIAANDSSSHTIYAAGLGDIEAERRRSGIGDLPLVEVPSPQPSQDAFAILYSGDGGWRDLDRSLADVLASKGMSVVGVDVLRYYWRPKAPDVAARDLARIIEHYQQHWGRKQVVLIGFSFGADVLPFLINRLPPEVRADIRLVSLLAPERLTAFEVQAAGWINRQSDATTPIEPELKLLSTKRLQCVYGGDEAKDSLCTTAAAAGHEIIRKPGGHHFDHNYGELASDIIAAAGP
ncbi:MAG TPA: AcvB/VirJ family lysyl-phosphatidylglycerol hydrolase [Steroidobacteraceae bacterium]